MKIIIWVLDSDWKDEPDSPALINSSDGKLSLLGNFEMLLYWQILQMLIHLTTSSILLHWTCRSPPPSPQQVYISFVWLF